MCGTGSWIEPPPDWCANCSRKFSKHLSPFPANPRYPYSPPHPHFSFLVSFSLPVSSIEKVKSRTIGIRLSISVFAGLSNRKRQAADWVLCQQIRKQAGCGRRGLPRGLGMAATRLWELRAQMKSALTKWGDWWMDKAGNWMWEWMRAEGEFNTDKQNERQRGIAC